MPSCEILSIGTELLLGQILNTNSQFLSEELAAIGINCYFQTTIGDNVERIKFSMKQALNRADILLHRRIGSDRRRFDHRMSRRDPGRRHDFRRHCYGAHRKLLPNARRTYA